MIYISCLIHKNILVYKALLDNVTLTTNVKKQIQKNNINSKINYKNLFIKTYILRRIKKMHRYQTKMQAFFVILLNIKIEYLLSTQFEFLLSTHFGYLFNLNMNSEYKDQK